MATASTSLDPSLDQAAMLRTENLVYSGTRPQHLLRHLQHTHARPSSSERNHPRASPSAPAPPSSIRPTPTCPPTCPPINLKFFGTATRANGTRQAFLLQGDDVFLASPGDIIARKYKIVSINANSIQVEDLINTNTQTLPLPNAS